MEKIHVKMLSIWEKKTSNVLFFSIWFHFPYLAFHRREREGGGPKFTKKMTPATMTGCTQATATLNIHQLSGKSE